MILERNLLSAALDRAAQHSTPLLTDALIEVLARTAPNSDRDKTLLSTLDRIQPDKPEQEIRLAAALAKLHQDEEAAAHYRVGLKADRPLDRATAAIGLAQIKEDKAAVPVLAELLKEHPNWFTGRDERGRGNGEPAAPEARPGEA